MAADFGTDFNCVFDVDANLTVVSGRLVLAQAVVRRWLCNPGTLFYSKTYGAGLLGYLSGPLDNADEIASRCEDQALQDDRVQACTVTVTILGKNTLRVDGYIDPGDGPFPLTLTLSPESAELIVGGNG